MNKKNINEDVFVHETSFVDNNVTIKRGTKIWHFSHISENAKIGKSAFY